MGGQSSSPHHGQILPSAWAELHASSSPLGVSELLPIMPAPTVGAPPQTRSPLLRAPGSCICSHQSSCNPCCCSQHLSASSGQSKLQRPRHAQLCSEFKISSTKFSLLETHQQRSLQLLGATRGASAPRAIPG